MNQESFTQASMGQGAAKNTGKWTPEEKRVFSQGLGFII